MKKVNSRSLNIGIAGGFVSLVALTVGLGACSAEGPTPAPTASQPATGASGSNTAGTGSSTVGTGIAPTGIAPVSNPPANPSPGGGTGSTAGTSTAAPSASTGATAAPGATDGTATAGGGAAQPGGAAAMPGAAGGGETSGAATMPAAGTGDPPATDTDVEMAGTEAPAEEDTDDTAAASGGEGNALVPTESLWVALGTNGVGVEGSWYGYEDEETTGCCDDLLTWEEGGTVCMAGTTAEREEGNYDIYGAGMGFNFADADAWDGSGYSGVSFSATMTSDADVYVKVKMSSTKVVDGGDFFVNLKSGSNSISWDDLEQPAWVVDAGDDIDFDPSDIEAIQFHVEPGDGGPNDFEICISDLAVED